MSFGEYFKQVLRKLANDAIRSSVAEAFGISPDEVAVTGEPMTLDLKTGELRPVSESAGLVSPDDLRREARAKAKKALADREFAEQHWYHAVDEAASQPTSEAVRRLNGIYAGLVRYRAPCEQRTRRMRYIACQIGAVLGQGCDKHGIDKIN